MSATVAGGLRPGVDPVPDLPLPLHEGPQGVVAVLARPQPEVPRVRPGRPDASHRRTDRGSEAGSDMHLLGVGGRTPTFRKPEGRQPRSIPSPPTGSALRFAGSR